MGVEYEGLVVNEQRSRVLYRDRIPYTKEREANHKVLTNYIPNYMRRVQWKHGQEGALLTIWVQDVPKVKSSKSRETNRLRDLRGIVRRPGEFKPLRHSWGTQYSKPLSESLTQPSRSGFAQKLA